MRIGELAEGAGGSTAPTNSRERLQAKLAELQQHLRTMRSGILRALDESWTSVDRSTSNAAYLVRRGRDPELRQGMALHVTNGESVASSLRSTSLDGVVV